MQGRVYTKQVKITENPHDCELCTQLIPQGSSAHYITGETDADYHSSWQHDSCWGTFLETSSYRRSDRRPHTVVFLAKALETGL